MSDIIPLSLLLPFACKCCQVSVIVSVTVPAVPQALSKIMRHINFSLFDAKKRGFKKNFLNVMEIFLKTCKIWNAMQKFFENLENFWCCAMFILPSVH